MSLRTRLARLERKRPMPVVIQLVRFGVEVPIRTPQGELLSYAEFRERYPLTEVMQLQVMTYSQARALDARKSSGST